MYYIVESPKVLNLPVTDVSHVKSLKANRDNMFICALTGNDIMIWLTTTSNLIAFYQRANNSVQIHGENHLIEWKSDSSKIAILTTKGYLIYYKISFENEFVLTDLSYSQTAWNDSSFVNNAQYQNPLLNCRITHEFSIHIQNCQKTLCCFGDEIYIPLMNGKVVKVPWTDRTRVDHFFFQLQSIYFQNEPDGEQFKLKENIYIIEFEMMNFDDGCLFLGACLSDGSAIYMSTDQANVFRGLIAKTDYLDKHIFHKCIAINPLFKLLAYGCKNGTILSYEQPENNSALSVSNKYSTYTQRDNVNVCNLKWSPDYRALCALYENGDFCLFSVFGSLLYDSKDLLSFELSNTVHNISKSFEFGVEGFSLWTYLETSNSAIHGSFTKLKILKSSLINNFSMSNIEHISLNGEREIYACLNLTKSDLYSQVKINHNKIPAKYQYPSHKLGGNSKWQILNIPLTYISSNFPVKISSIDPDGKYLALAGVNGFTHYSFLTRKWKIFGNADQEKEFQVTGGLLWWKDFILMTCFNQTDQKDELRFYSRNTNLDNKYSKKSRTTCRILQMNTFKNVLILLGTDCRIQVIGLDGGKDSNVSKIILNRLMELHIETYVQGNPYLVIGIALCPITCGINHNDLIRTNIESNSSTLKSILVNVSGKLLMFQPEPNSLLSIPEDLKKTKPYTSLPPVLTSDKVEVFWVTPNNQAIKLQNNLMNFTLWLHCGSQGVKLWLPLSGEDNELQQSNRVFLKLPLNFYPLSLLINEGLFMGVGTELTLINQNLAYAQMQKVTQLFVPFVLEGLIRKKLFLDAKKIAICYRYLPYFLHILELLVHKALEEEANVSEDTDTSNHVLEDVINFIEKFPEYLKIISHCTRKSEVAVWPHLFSIVGDSCKLFEKCLNLNDLETAGSYLVVLQNTEKLKLCQKYANMLLRASLKSCEWDLVKEIIRFLSAIDPDDLEEDIFDSSHDKKNKDESPEKSVKSSARSSTSSISNTPLSPSNGNNDESLISKKKLSKTRSYSSNDYKITIQSIQNTVLEHAWFLVRNYRIRQLFGMFANLSGFSIKKWLNQLCEINKQRGTKLINNYVLALSGLHFDFNWPYPLIINDFKKTNSFICLENESADETESKILKNEITHTDSLNNPIDVNLIAHQLANTGSLESESQLSYLMDVFISVDCHEWIFLLALVLKRMAIVNEILRQLLAGELPDNTANGLKQGISELDIWTHDECCGYREIIHKISEYC